MSVLPPSGRWALGAESQALAERLVQAAQQEGRRTAWLAPEAGFLSNLSVLENLRLIHDWLAGSSMDFAADLEQACRLFDLPLADWLQQRPAQLRARQLLEASLLRIALVKPELLVLHPATLAQIGPARTHQLVAAFAEARLLLLAEPALEWPAWPQTESAFPAEEHPA